MTLDANRLTRCLRRSVAFVAGSMRSRPSDPPRTDRAARGTAARSVSRGQFRRGPSLRGRRLVALDNLEVGQVAVENFGGHDGHTGLAFDGCLSESFKHRFGHSQLATAGPLPGLEHAFPRAAGPGRTQSPPALAVHSVVGLVNQLAVSVGRGLGAA